MADPFRPAPRDFDEGEGDGKEVDDPLLARELWLDGIGGNSVSEGGVPPLDVVLPEGTAQVDPTADFPAPAVVEPPADFAEPLVPDAPVEPAVPDDDFGDDAH
jgi:hypothetical protein